MVPEYQDEGACYLFCLYPAFPMDRVRVGHKIKVEQSIKTTDI